MDALRLLSRSTRQPKRSAGASKAITPSEGQLTDAQLFPLDNKPTASLRKRKRRDDGARQDDDVVDYFDQGRSKEPMRARSRSKEVVVEKVAVGAGASQTVTNAEDSPEERKAVLRQHKLKISWLNSTHSDKGMKRKRQETMTDAKPVKQLIYPRPIRLFGELQLKRMISNQLAENLQEEGYSIPTDVQLGALPLLLDRPSTFLPGASHEVEAIDLLTVAPTGSGKTLAFMIPLIEHIRRSRNKDSSSHRPNAAVILAPTKELVAQIVNEGRKLAHKTGIKVVQVRKGMQLLGSFQQSPGDHDLSVKADILVSTPGVLHSILGEADGSQCNLHSSIRHLVLDEADVLLDPLFREQTLGVWNAISSDRLRVSLWSATMGSNIENLARSTIQERRARLVISDNTPLIRLVVGLKDSAVPNVEHKLVYAATEEGKLMGLRQILHPNTSSAEAGPSLRPPFLVFTQTIERAVALHSELMYDIPVEAGGISRIAVLHSDLSDTARDSVMTRFRKGEVWILITTDLLSRGVDFRGINGVVNYDIPTSSAAYVHRVGRTGRAGRTGGVAVTLYSQEDIPYLKHVANVVAMAQKQKGDTNTDGLQPWLLDALPKLSKQDKQKLKKRGIESRTARGKEADPKAARRAKISTKPGFQRQAENKRRGAILGSQKRKQEEEEAEAESGSDADGEFRGFG